MMLITVRLRDVGGFSPAVSQCRFRNQKGLAAIEDAMEGGLLTVDLIPTRAASTLGTLEQAIASPTLPPPHTA